MAAYRPPRWTRASRKNIHGIRHPHKTDDAALTVPSAAAAWAWLREHDRSHSGDEKVRAEPVFADLLAAHQASMARATPPTPPLSVTQELLRAGLLLHMGPAYSARAGEVLAALVGLWAGQDPAFPVQMATAVAPFHVSGLYGGTFGYMLSVVPLEPNPHGHRWPMRLHDVPFERLFWVAYRAWLLAAPEPLYAQARAAAAPLRETLRGGTHAQQQVASGLAYAFSREAVWATEDAEALLRALAERTPLPGGAPSLILPALTDAQLALTLAQRLGGVCATSLYDLAFDIVESLGGAAVPVLEALLQNSLAKHQRAPIAAALKLALTAAG